MIEKQFVSQKLKEFQIQYYLKSQLEKTGYSHTEIKKTPLGEKIIIYTTRPGIVVGRKGDNIKLLTNVLKRKFKLENPQIEIGEIDTPSLDVDAICDRIVSTLERFGPKRFKSIGYRMLQEIMDAGAMGTEIIISGKVPSSRARSWRFSEGYLKKSGDVAETQIKKAIGAAKLKSGVVGVKVSIMLPGTLLPDKLQLKQEEKKEDKQPTQVTEKKEETKDTSKEGVKENKEVKKPKKEKKEVKEETSEAKEEKPKEEKSTKKESKVEKKEEVKEKTVKEEPKKEEENGNNKKK